VLYYVRVLDAKDDWLGLLGTVTSMATIGGWMLWRYVMGRWGEPVTLQTNDYPAGIISTGGGTDPFPVADPDPGRDQRAVGAGGQPQPYQYPVESDASRGP
jgi:hypothetical protein